MEFSFLTVKQFVINDSSVFQELVNLVITVGYYQGFGSLLEVSGCQAHMFEAESPHWPILAFWELLSPLGVDRRFWIRPMYAWPLHFI